MQTKTKIKKVEQAESELAELLERRLMIERTTRIMATVREFLTNEVGPKVHMPRAKAALSTYIKANETLCKNLGRVFHVPETKVKAARKAVTAARRGGK